jgi:hypothetical protein
MENVINPQRQRNFWEPIYEPNIKIFDIWKATPDEIRHLKGIKRLIVNLSIIQDSNSSHLSEFLFEKVDFIGFLDGGQMKFTFRKCNFTKCSFRNTEFTNIKFTECIFDHTTFALGYFKNCEFRNCTYKQIGVSGNSMILEDCYLDPKLFLESLFLNKDLSVLKEKNTNLQYQKFQQTKTKAVIARRLTEMQPIKNDIEFHILSIKTARKYEILSSYSESYYFVTHGKFFDRFKNLFNLIYSMLEFPVIMTFGWLSGWGYKIGKTIFIGLIFISLFSFINYGLIFKCDTYSESVLKTFEYWLLFGYTKYDFNLIPHNFQWLIFVNSFLGMIWFAALIPIIINKLGKSNE